MQKFNASASGNLIPPTLGAGKINPVQDYDGVSVTPSDTVDLPSGMAKAIFATGAGHVLLNRGTPESSATSPAAVTPNDGADLPGGVCVGLIATGAGTIAVQYEGAGPNTASITVVAGGVSVPILGNVKRVLATGTTATGISALYAGAVLQVPANTIVPANAQRVLSTGTTATGISALY